MIKYKCIIMYKQLPKTLETCSIPVPREEKTTVKK